ncbi:MAG: Ig-like domain-containing protein [Myxococcales bacterium]|nr:Ig-like domain-containing protein [Myxococcales bacterium]
MNQTPRLSKRRSLVLAVLSLAAVSALIGCADEKPEGGSSNAECGTDQVCNAGVCADAEERSCRTNNDCRDDEICYDSTCQPVEDLSAEVEEDSTEADVSDTRVIADVHETSEQDEAGEDLSEQEDESTPPVEDIAEEVIFTTAPTIVATTPEDDSQGVAVDADVVIQFSQPMNSATLLPSNVHVESGVNGASVDRVFDYDNSTYTLTLSPSNQNDYFEEITPYVVTVETVIRAVNGQNLATEYTFKFSTLRSDDELYNGLAETFAPVIYQEVTPRDGSDRFNRLDWFTNLDFDVDLNPANNWGNATDGDARAPHVYWNVLETETNYFVQYVLYYPLGSDAETTPSWTGGVVANDFVFVTVSLAKSDTFESGYEFQFFTVAGNRNLRFFGLDEYPNPESECGGAEQADCYGVAPPEGGSNWWWRSFDGADDVEGLVEGTHPQIYVTNVTHSGCTRSDTGGNNPLGGEYPCSHPVGGENPFPEGDATDWSRVVSLGETATNWAEYNESNNQTELTYTMSPFLDTFWALRGDQTVYASPYLYSYNPSGNGGGDYPTMARLLATGHEGDGANQRRMEPWRVNNYQPKRVTCGGCSSSGTWFYDPAYEFATLDHDGAYVPAAGAEYNPSVVYCYNPFFAIDRRGAADCERE